MTNAKTGRPRMVENDPAIAFYCWCKAARRGARVIYDPNCRSEGPAAERAARRGEVKLYVSEKTGNHIAERV